MHSMRSVRLFCAMRQFSSIFLYIAKVNIENEKVDIEPKTVDIQKLKVNYIKRLKAIEANKSTLQKIDVFLNVVE